MDRATKGTIGGVSVNGVPVFVHWSVLVGWFFVSWVVGFRLPEALYTCVTYSLLVFLHELSHAAAARAFKLKVLAIVFSGIGGHCAMERPRSFVSALIVIAAGLATQVLILALTLVALYGYGKPNTALGGSIAAVFTVINGLVIAINIAPQRPSGGMASDGYILWTLMKNRWSGRGFSLPDTSLTFSPTLSLLKRKELVPAGFMTGIEIFNDNSTPMAFVVAVLVKHLRLKEDVAVATMLQIHKDGGILIPLPTRGAAETVAAGITADAARGGHPLLCRPVESANDPISGHGWWRYTKPDRDHA